MNESFNIEIAKTIFKVYPIYDKTKTFCNDFLSDDSEEFVITITEDDIDLEKEKYYKIYKRHLRRIELYEQYALLRHISRLLFIHKDIALFHGSSFKYNDSAYIVTGISGTGKSTHSKLWTKKYPEIVMINDDKPFIEFQDENIIVHSNPWNGKEKIGNNISAKLDSIVCLEQSKNNAVFEMNYNEKWKFLVNQFYIPEDNEYFPKFLQLLDQLIEKTNIIGLRCNKEMEAVDVLHKALMEDRK